MVVLNDTNETIGRGRQTIIYRLLGKKELPVVDMKIHAPISAIEEGMNPDSTATAGRARMPDDFLNAINILHKEWN